MPHSRRPPLASVFIMAWLTHVCVIFSRLVVRKAPLVGAQAKSLPALSCTGRCLPAFSHTVHIMTRPRGRPKRGSPWKPRRPPVTPPGSPFWLSLPSSSVGCSPARFDGASMATTSRSPISLSCHLHDPLVKFPPPAPFHGSSGDPSSERA
jgi:hypothetical protein